VWVIELKSRGLLRGEAFFQKCNFQGWFACGAIQDPDKEQTRLNQSPAPDFNYSGAMRSGLDAVGCAEGRVVITERCPLVFHSEQRRLVAGPEKILR
jgi:hypothetical protein